MYGWRGRIGLVLPADNTIVEPEYAKVLPEGISAHAVRLSTGDQRERMPVEAVEMAPSLKEAEVDIVGYFCAASSFLLGPDGNRKLVTDLSTATDGLPAFTASTAMADALRRVGGGRISVLSPHRPNIAAKLGEYLEADGFEIAGLTALDMGLQEINGQYPGHVYQAVRAMDHADADAIFIAATNFRAFEVVPHLERDLGLPVITSNQASLSAALTLLGVNHVAPEYGRLFAARG